MKQLTILLKKNNCIKPQYDYIIVGQGLAGTILHFHLWERGKKVLVIDNNHNKSASKVAAGMYNPIVFKRVTKGWNVDQLSPYLKQFYNRIQKHLNTQLDFPINILRFFKNIEQQNDFFSKTEDSGFTNYLISESESNVDANPIINDIGFGEITNSGWVNTKALLSLYREFLSENELILSEKFDKINLENSRDFIQYKNIKADKIIFCEGTQIKNNSFFNYLPLVPTKGELFTIKAPELNMEKIINKGFFILPLGNGLYRMGATYNWKDLNYDVTESGKTELKDKIATLINCDYEIVDHQAGIRPTVKDRRPFIGIHPKYKNLAVFNGMGTKGILIAPFFANHFCDFLDGKTELDNEVDIARFKA